MFNGYVFFLEICISMLENEEEVVDKVIEKLREKNKKYWSCWFCLVENFGSKNGGCYFL